MPVEELADALLGDARLLADLGEAVALDEA
jgi:hypothetical protein